MDVAAIRGLRRRLDGVRSEHLRREPSAARDDLIAETRLLESEAHSINIPQFVTVAAMRRADIEIALERWTDALASLVSAREHVHSLAEHEHGVFLLRMEAQAHAGLGDWAEVRRVCRQGIDIVEPGRTGVSPTTLQSSYLRFRIGLYELAVRAEIEFGDLEAALSVAELVKCRSLSRAVTPGVAFDRTLLDDFRKVSEQIERVVTDGGDPRKSVAKRRSLWHLIQTSRYADREGGSAPLSLSELQAGLETDEAVVSFYWMGVDRLLVTAFDREHVRWLSEIVGSDDVTAIRERALALQEAKPPNSAADLPGGFTDFLLPDEIHPILRGKRRLLISPHRRLHALPLHALRWKGGYLLESYAVTYIPNLAVLARRREAIEGGAVLAVGVHESRAPKADRLGPLPDADAEVRGVKDLYGASRCRALLGDDASESALTDLDATGELTDFDVLHFACHGINVDSDNPMESSLFLRDSALDGLDIATWDLDATLVVLTACCAGQRPVAGRGMDELPGDDLFGLQAAFFAAGADQIISTLWPVDSSAARTISLSLHRRIEAGMSAEVALQEAVVEFLEDARARGSLKRQKPYTWAPFFLVANSRIH